MTTSIFSDENIRVHHGHFNLISLYFTVQSKHKLNHSSVAQKVASSLGSLIINSVNYFEKKCRNHKNGSGKKKLSIAVPKRRKLYKKRA